MGREHFLQLAIANAVSQVANVQLRTDGRISLPAAASGHDPGGQVDPTET
jgi:hypothetical protein